MVCIRSVSSDEAKRLTYSVFFGIDRNKALAGQYLKSRYSVTAENCTAQAFHPLAEAVAPSSSPPPSAVVEPKKHRKHHE
jgi:hypothetical protein